jgi:aryl-alcohol dehydrogenase-like predicted oxidoreductase
MEQRRLGRIGHMSSVIIYGGAMLSEVTQDAADASIEFALAAGINHFDTAAAYGDSELRLGPWMPRIRDRIFLATKTGDRTSSEAHDSIRRSMERLRVDRVDLIQLHEVCDLETLDQVTGPGGALEGAIRAEEEGLVGAIGITGHGMMAPAVHLEALRRFAFHTVITPFNAALAGDRQYLHDFDELAEEVQAQNAGLMLIKAAARNLWRTGEAPRYTTWYEPLDQQQDIDAAIAFALARPEATGVCSPSDVRLLPMVVDAERRVGSVTAEEAAALLTQVRGLGAPFLPSEGREVPDWLAPLIRNR